MRQSLALCSCHADSEAAQSLRDYLALNCPWLAAQDLALAPSGREFLDTAERALSADVALVLLSPHAVPVAWTRQQWEPVLTGQAREMGTAVAYLLLAPCRFPEVLRKQRFFDLSADWRGGVRKVQQWLLQQRPLQGERADVLPAWPAIDEVPEQTVNNLALRLVDRPGMADGISGAAALAFARAHGESFEGVFWIDCARRSCAGVLGDVAQSLGLKLAGSLTQNRSALQEFVGGRRCLFLFEELSEPDRQSVQFGGAASVIFIAGSRDRPSTLPLTEAAVLFARWRREPERCLAHLGAAVAYVGCLNASCGPAEAAELTSLGNSLFALLLGQERLAEAYEIAGILLEYAWSEGELHDLARWEREKGWIEEAWG